METPLDKHILELLNKNGEMHSKDIFASKPDVSVNTFRKRLSKLKADGKIEMPTRSYYARASAPPSPAALRQQRQKLSDLLRAPDANKKTIDRLLNIYDKLIDCYEAWIEHNIGADIDFEQQLLFIENFKWLTAIGDKLMKRWSLEHVGYDTNTRLAQEDAKAQTQEREKEALKDAPIEEQVNVVGSFDLDTKQLIDGFPKLEDMTEEEKEKAKV